MNTFSQKLHIVRRSSLTLLLGVVFLSHAAFGQVSALKKRVAVFRFDDKTEYANSGRPGQGMADMLTTALVQSGNYVVLERQEIDAILNEQNLGTQGVVSPETAAQVGKILGVDLAVMGTVTEFGYKKGDVGGTTQKLGVGIGRESAVVAIDVRLVDTSSGVVATAENVRKSSSRAGLSLKTEKWDFANRSEFDQTLVGKATRDAIESIVEIVDANADKVRWEGRVVANLNGNIVINAGARGGVRVGDQFQVLRAGEALVDPETGLNLGSIESEMGVIEVTDNQIGDGRASQCSVVSGEGEMERGDIVREIR